MSNYRTQIEAKLEDIASAVRRITGDYDLSNYLAITAAIRNGDGDKVPNGTVFTVPHDVYGNIDFVTRCKNVHKVVGEEDRPTITIQSKYLISKNAGTSASTFQYDRSEAMFKPLTEAITSGTVVKFTATAYSSWVAGDYHFTASADLPAGTMLCLSGRADTALASLNVNAYANQKSTTSLATMAISSGDGDATVNLGTWVAEGGNHPQRISYGSNNEAESNLFQFLNGDSGDLYMDSIFVPKTKYDMMPSNFATLKGFLGGFPDDFRACLGLCSIPNITNDVYEADGSAYTKSTTYSHNGYFFLPSRKEIYGTDENARESAETQIPYFANVGTTNADKLMYAKGASAPTSYWLRTPHAGNANNVRICNTGTGGALNGNIAYYSNGVAPLAILA